MSSSLWPWGLQHTRLPCPSLSPWVSSNSCPLNQWCHPTISSSVTPFFCCSQSFRASGTFLMSWLFPSGGQRIEVSASALASVLPMNIQGWFPLGLTGLFSLLPKGLSRVFSNTTVQKHQFFGIQSSLWSKSHIHTWLLKKNIALPVWRFVGKVRSLLFNMLSRFVIYFLPRNKHLLISRLQLQSTSDFGVQEKKMCHCFQFFNSYLPLNNGTGCCYLSFFNVEINQHFHSLLSSLSRALLVPFLFLPLNWYNLHIWGY